MNDERPDPAVLPESTVRRRGHRRAVGGTAPPGTGGTDVAPAALGRSRDDTDDGWGERSGPDDDERFLREVPPHW